MLFIIFETIGKSEIHENILESVTVEEYLLRWKKCSPLLLNTLRLGPLIWYLFIVPRFKFISPDKSNANFKHIWLVLYFTLLVASKLKFVSKERTLILLVICKVSIVITLFLGKFWGSWYNERSHTSLSCLVVSRSKIWKCLIYNERAVCITRIQTSNK